ncbi:MAG: hypothetical protein KTV77_02155 [Wolbachia endosymbiont of Fragariocoptes setiger]|nr:hypothetical protein [Wolbachia endosymbiont of Fragariocoptes setiger]
MPPKNTVISMNMKNINEDINVNSNASNIVESKNSTNSTKNNDTDKKKGSFSDLQEKWKKLNTTKKAGIVGAIAGTLITLSPLIGVLATLTLPRLILGGIAYGAVKGSKV